MPEGNFHEPQRQSLVGVLVYIARNFRIMISLFITVIAIGATNPKFFLYSSFAVGPLIVFLIVLAWYQYRNFTFHVAGEELIIHKGVFFKERVVIAADRIQSIQITESIFQRILGVVALKVDTAGSKGNELSINALELSRAEMLKDLLYKIKEIDLPEETIAEETTTVAAAAKSEERVLVHLSLLDLLKVGLTENHLRTGLIALAFTFGYISQYQEYIQKYLEGYVDEYAEQVANAGVTLILTFIFFYIIISIIISLVRTLLRFYDLKAVLKADAVEISTGLLQRQRSRIPINKIQFVQWETNPLRRLAGFESAKLKPTNPVGEIPRQQVNEIPALKFRESELLADGIFPGYEAPEHGFNANAMAYLRINIILWSFLILPGTSVAYFFFGWQALLLLLLYIPIGFFAYQYGKRVFILLNETYVLLLRGWIFPKRIVIPAHKVQSIAIEQNIILKRRGLCHLNLFTAAGSRMVRYLSENEAKELRDYMLYKIEKYNEPWM
jgi:putative membrane protein